MAKLPLASVSSAISTLAESFVSARTRSSSARSAACLLRSPGALNVPASSETASVRVKDVASSPRSPSAAHDAGGVPGAFPGAALSFAMRCVDVMSTTVQSTTTRSESSDAAYDGWRRADDAVDAPAPLLSDDVPVSSFFF